jgi:adenosylhomocysteine nucleosidase
MPSPFTRRSASLLVALWCLVGAACATSGTAGSPRAAAEPKADAVDIVIQGAVDSEVDPLVAALANAQKVQIGAWTFWRGRMAGRAVVVSRTEVGPINAAAATTLAIRTFRPRLIINQGTAGATVPRLRVFDMIVGEATVDYGGFRSGPSAAGAGSNPADWQRMPHRLRLDGEERIALPVFPGDPTVLAIAMARPYSEGRLVKGIIGSAFQFNREVDRLNWIHEKYDAISEDMESAFAAGTALGFGTPFLAVRIISDSDFYAPGIHPDAAAICARFVTSLVSALPQRLEFGTTGRVAIARPCNPGERLHACPAAVPVP